MEGGEQGFFQNLNTQLQELSRSVATQSINAIPQFDGDPKSFKGWIREIEKYGLLMGVELDRLKLMAYQASKGPVSDFLMRYLRDHPHTPWPQVKAELSSRFSEVTDEQHALMLLRRVKQGPQEPVQVYAEKLLSIAEDAFQNQMGHAGQIEQQLINFFIDGLNTDGLKLKIMRENPATLQAAIALAMTEQNLYKRFDLRTGRRPFQRYVRTDEHEPMDVSQLRPPRQRCYKCQRFGHFQHECKQGKKQVRAVKGEDKFWDYIVCYRCGRRGHFQRDCRFDRGKELICFNCQERGHIARDCKSEKTELKGGRGRNAPKVEN